MDVQFTEQQAHEQPESVFQAQPPEPAKEEKHLPDSSLATDAKSGSPAAPSSIPGQPPLSATATERSGASSSPSQSASQPLEKVGDESKPEQNDLLSQMGLYQIPEDIDEEVAARATDPLAGVEEADDALDGFDESETRELEELDKELRKLEGTTAKMDVEPEQPASEPAVGEQDSSSAELSAAHEETSIDDEEKPSPAEAGSDAGNEHEQIGSYEAGRATESDAEEWDAELERLGPMREPGEIVAGAQKVRFAAGTHLCCCACCFSVLMEIPFSL